MDILVASVPYILLAVAGGIIGFLIWKNYDLLD